MQVNTREWNGNKSISKQPSFKTDSKENVGMREYRQAREHSNSFTITKKHDQIKNKENMRQNLDKNVYESTQKVSGNLELKSEESALVLLFVKSK